MLKNIGIIILLVFATTQFIAEGRSSQFDNINESANTSEDEKAPDFTLLTLNGEEVKLTDYEDKIVILDFWATWCGPCRKGIPDLVSIQKEYKDDVVVIGISLDQPSTQRNIEPFINHFGINYPIVLGTIDVVVAYGNIQAIPTSFIIDKERNIVKKHVGLVP
ncbi:MAG: TlpA family protein disulfide reductase, partial [Ignavibacterium sp.]